MIAVIGAPSLFGLLISKEKSYFVVQIFRNTLPQMLCNFYIFGISKWISLKLRLINKKHANEDDDIIFYA
jgi:hypothetical protein